MRLWKSGKVGALVGCATLGFAIGILAVAGTHVKVLAQAAPAAAQAPAQAPAQPAARVFGSDAGLVLNFIKPDKTDDFEAVVARLKQALQKSDKPERKQQAATWRVFRAVEPGANGAVLYVFDIDPAVHGADYTVSTILAEAFPDEVQDLYKRYADAYASGQNFVNLKLVAALGQ
jgi:23S rRNA G2069 N7-methylase RlmK/C1962 C5-methylase RlmI